MGKLDHGHACLAVLTTVMTHHILECCRALEKIEGGLLGRQEGRPGRHPQHAQRRRPQHVDSER